MMAKPSRFNKPERYAHHRTARFLSHLPQPSRKPDSPARPPGRLPSPPASHHLPASSPGRLASPELVPGPICVHLGRTEKA
jgi:hypothetical protein